MKKIIIFILIAFSFEGYSQILDPVLGPRSYKKEDNAQREAIALTPIREADVMWSTRILREIDLRQKMNQPLYFPLDSALHGKRSLVQILYDDFINNPASNVKMYKNDNFLVPLTQEEAVRMVARQDSVWKIDSLGNAVRFFAQNLFDDVKPKITKIELMEDQLFDKQRSVMDVRLLALSIKIPVYQVDESLDVFNNVVVFNGYKIMDGYNELWFFFPDLRPTFAVLECYKRQNDAARLSYDDIFLQRIFSSYIYREENVFDRTIANYTAGLDALLESENIKNNISELEQDLWQY